MRRDLKLGEISPLDHPMSANIKDCMSMIKKKTGFKTWNFVFLAIIASFHRPVNRYSTIVCGRRVSFLSEQISATAKFALKTNVSIPIELHPGLHDQMNDLMVLLQMAFSLQQLWVL